MSTARLLDDYSRALRGEPKSQAATPSTAGCIAMLVMWPISWVLWAYARVTLWEWFIVPFGLPSLTMLWSIGLGCAIATFTTRPVTKAIKDDNPDEQVMRMFGYAICGPLILLALGWVCVWFGVR